MLLHNKHSFSLGENLIFIFDKIDPKITLYNYILIKFIISTQFIKMEPTKHEERVSMTTILYMHSNI